MTTPFLSRRSALGVLAGGVVNDLMQHGYSYLLTEPAGRNFDPGFQPDLTPRAMLALGVFGGKYMTDCRGEFPPVIKLQRRNEQ